MLGFLNFLENFSECQILCSVFFHALTLKFPIQTSLSVAPKLPVYTRSGEKYEHFSKMSSILPLLRGFYSEKSTWEHHWCQWSLVSRLSHY